MVRGSLDTTCMAQQTLHMGESNATGGVSQTLIASPDLRSSSDLGSLRPSSVPPEIEKNYNMMGATEGAPSITPRADKAGRAMAIFSESWRAKYGVAYAASDSDWGLLRKFISHTAADLLPDLPAAFGRYLADNSTFVMQEMRHSLKYFLTSNAFNKYRTPEVVVTTQREVDNARAGEQWLAMSQGPNGHGRR